MQILTRDNCSECDGCGRVTNAIWMDFYQADDEYAKHHNGNCMEQPELENWFVNKGYYKIPPEEPQCSECEGSGVIEKWIDIKDLSKLINKPS
jgi:hypothetical protein